jgi:sec-independent protein translocase protein TatB
MFADLGWSELLMVGVVALLVIGPKDLPKAMRFAGQWVGKARSVARQFRSGFDNMVREAELAEMEKQWAEENARIMRAYPNAGALTGPDKAADSSVPAASPADTAQVTPVEDREDAEPVMTERPAIRDDGAAAAEETPAAPETSPPDDTPPPADKPGA